MSIFDEVLSFIHAPRPRSFEALALQVFRYQFARVPAYRDYCHLRGIKSDRINRVEEIPFASTVAFKHVSIENVDESGSPGALTFMTSGTSRGFADRGRHIVPHPEIYRASAVAHLRRMVFRDGAQMAMLALHPTADRMPESSLSTMISWCIEEFGNGTARCVATPVGVDITAAMEFLETAMARYEPVALFGTTAAFAALFRAIGPRKRALALAPGSRLMDTGGAKGQLAPLGPAQVVDEARRALGIDPSLVINEYGMTELCSQLYDATPFNSQVETAAGSRVKLPPPWMRPFALDPQSLNPVEEGRPGLLAFFDLANVGSISPVMTEDFGVVDRGAVAVLGRATAGGLRGCALGIDQFARAGSARPGMSFEDEPVGTAVVAKPLYNTGAANEVWAAASGIRAALRKSASSARIAEALAEACDRWRDQNFAPRRETIAAIAAAWGFTEALLDESLDTLLKPFTRAALERFSRDLPMHPAVVGLILPGNVPGAGMHEVATALIAGRGVILKTATPEPFFFARFVQSLGEIDREIGARIAVINWGRENDRATSALSESCDQVVAFGDDETITRLADSLAAGFGSRASGVFVSHEIAEGPGADQVAAAIARDGSLFEQVGCLSPHQVFVEARAGAGQDSARREWARAIATALDRLAQVLPPPRRYGLEDAAALRRARESARWRAIGGDPVELFTSGAGAESFGWTVVFDPGATFTISPGYRTITVSVAADERDLRRRLEPVAGRIEAFAIAAPESRSAELRSILKSLGASYICAPGEMQSPPLEWPHGGGAFSRMLRGVR